MSSHRVLFVFAASALIAASCSSSATKAAPSTTAVPVTSPATVSASTTPAATVAPATQPAPTQPATTQPSFPPASFTVQPGVEQLAVRGAIPGETLDAYAVDGAKAASGMVDTAGSLLFRQLKPGSYTVRTTSTPLFASPPAAVMDRTTAPPQSLYDGQKMTAPGFGYITTRDGTTLSADVLLPKGDGPFPTVVEYSGYDPSNPDNTALAQLYVALGFAYVGVNMRGTGCSGGSYQFFEYVQSLDGYDAVEAVAAQPWVLGHQVGMVGISYPGISQLFVAQTRPPHLAAITPLSVLDDSYRSTLYPGGILNTGFAVSWAQDRVNSGKPYGEAWSKKVADAGDKTCAANQDLRLQNPDLLQIIKDNPTYDPAIGDVIAPVTFVDKINVPVFLAGAWQDEQTGGHFPAMLDKFTSAPHLYATMVNGLHTESLSLGILARYVEFLDLYVAKKAPDTTALAAAGPLLASTLTGVSGLQVPLDDYSGLDYEQSLAKFEAQPPIRVLFEEGAAAGQPAASNLPRFEGGFASWPIPGTQPLALYFGKDGALQSAAPTEPAGTAGSIRSYTYDPTAVPPTFYTGDGNAIWRADVKYQWLPLPSGKSLSWISAPLTADTVTVGSGSVDMWLQSSAADTDLEVTLSEVRPDGTEVMIQSGWLRASQRKLDEQKSTELRPVQTHLSADVQPLPAGQFVPVRVELFPFGYAFRAGSQIRISVEAPAGNRAVWAFDALAGGATNQIASDADHPSRVVLPVVSGVTVPAGIAPCGSLRGEPCRPYVAPTP